MAPSSQKFTQGGILIRDWFSDRLEAGGEATLEKNINRQDNYWTQNMVYRAIIMVQMYEVWARIHKASQSRCADLGYIIVFIMI